MKIGPISFSWLDVLLIAMPTAIVLEIVHANAVAIFIVSCVAIIPLAGWMGKATEHLAAHFGPGLGGLLNASFGNAAELIIAIMALRQGLFDVVKASITGSIIGNILLVLGLSLLVGGVRFRRQSFNRTAAGMGSTLLLLSVVGLAVPTVFGVLAGDRVSADTEQTLSIIIAGILFVSYLLSLLFQLKTHQHLFMGDGEGHHIEKPWSKGLALGVLLGATALVALMSEFLVGSVEHTAEVWGMSEVFVGVILVAIIGNAAEHSSAIIMAFKNHMDLAIQIAVGSSIQIALLIAPILIFFSYMMGPGPISLEFTTLEVLAVAFSVLIVKSVAVDGESHWMEGVLLLAVYVILGVAFYFLP